MGRKNERGRELTFKPYKGKRGPGRWRKRIDGKDLYVTGRFKTGQRGARFPGFKTGQCCDASYTSCSSLISNNV